MIHSKNIKTIILIVILCSVLDIVFHAGASQFLTITPDGWNQSVLVKIIGFQATVIIWAHIAFGTAAYFFIRFQRYVSGRASSRALKFGIIIGLIWFWGNIENYAISGMALTHEIIMAICDGVPVVLLGYLLSRIPTVRNMNHAENSNREIPVSRHSVMTAATIGITFVIFRYIAYMTELISSGYETRPTATLVWTIIMGVITGVLYLSVQSSFRYDSLLKGAVKLGMLFGGIWLSFSIMIPLAFEGFLIDIVLRCFIDILAVGFSYYLSNSLNMNKSSIRRTGAAS